jgi:hypothetical protein
MIICFQNHKNLVKDALTAIARNISEQHGSPWSEPIAIQNRLLSWTIITNRDKIGWNVMVTVSKRAGNPVRWSYIPR